MHMHRSLRFILSAGLLALLATGLASTPRTAEAAGGVHPTSGNSALTWYTRLSEARTAARTANKLLFVEVSRPASKCRKCRDFFGRVLTSRGQGARVNSVAVGIHFDWRGVDATVYNRLRRNVRSERIDPMIAFLTPDLGFVSGFAPGARSNSTSMRGQLERCLRKAEAKHAAMNGRKTVDPNPPVVKPAPPVVKPTPPVVKPTPPVVKTGPTTSRGLRWYRNWNEAARAARAEGKFVMVLSTKPSCSICDKVKNKSVPVVQREISQHAVAYLYDITRPENRRVDKVIRSMNRGAGLMPLAGFMTADMRPLKGFSGSNSAQQLRSHLRAAQRANRR